MADLDPRAAAFLDAVRAVPDPLQRARLAGELLDPVRAELAAIRRDAVVEARSVLDDRGRPTTWASIGDALGVTGARAQMIVAGRTR